MESIHLDAFFENRSKLAELLEVDVPLDWPWSETGHILGWMQEKLNQHPDLCKWLGWFIIKTDQKTLIGDAGFAGKPDRFATVTLGYNILPAYQRQGFGFEAAYTLTKWVFDHESVKTVSAQTAHEAEASIKILKKLGMHKTAATKDILNWEVEKKAFLALTQGDLPHECKNNNSNTGFVPDRT